MYDEIVKTAVFCTPLSKRFVKFPFGLGSRLIFLIGTVKEDLGNGDFEDDGTGLFVDSEMLFVRDGLSANFQTFHFINTATDIRSSFDSAHNHTKDVYKNLSYFTEFCMRAS